MLADMPMLSKRINKFIAYDFSFLDSHRLVLSEIYQPWPGIDHNSSSARIGQTLECRLQWYVEVCSSSACHRCRSTDRRSLWPDESSLGTTRPRKKTVDVPSKSQSFPENSRSSLRHWHRPLRAQSYDHPDFGRCTIAWNSVVSFMETAKRKQWKTNDSLH